MATPENKFKHKSRAFRIKEVQREEIRKKFKANEYIRQLEQAYKEYETIAKELATAKIRKKETKGSRDAIAELNTQIDLLRIRLDVIKGKIDLNIKRLKFCVPELKAVELTDGQGNDPFSTFAAAVKAMSEAV